MKIGYCLIDSPFKFHLSYFNDNLNYKPQITNLSVFMGLSSELQARPPVKLRHPGSCCIMQHCRHNTIIHISECTLNVLLVTKCQQAKPSGPGHGLLPGQDIAGAPWEEIAVDLIGPWSASTPHGTVGFFALTCIDTITNLVKIAQIFEKSSYHVATRFEHTWLSQYPKPMQVIHDNGAEFTRFAFQHLLRLLNIKPVPTTNKNPQANAIFEQIHQTVATVLKTLACPTPQTRCQAVLLVDAALATTMHALWSTVSTMLQATLGGLDSLKTCFSIFLFLLIGRQSFQGESN